MNRLICALPLALLFSMQVPKVIEITMDDAGDYVQRPYNTVRNDETGEKYATLEQGAGLDYINDVFVTRPLLKSSIAARRGSHGLDFTLPARLPDVPYADSKDRLETILWDDAPLSKVSSIAHYSGFSIMIPSTSGVVHDWFLIHQWHQSSPESPPISLQLLPGYNSRLGLRIRYGANKGNETYFYLPRADDESGDEFIDLPTDKWVDFIVRWKFDVSGTDGEVIVFRHDVDWPSSVQIFNYSGQIGYTNVVDGNTIDEKFGLYRNGDEVSSHTIYYDQLRVGKSYAEVKPWP
jgi:hypothetical protein